MARKKKNDALTDGLSVNISGMVVITVEQYREYQNLLEDRDKTLEAVRAQARVLEQGLRASAIRLSRAVVSEVCAGNAFELANEILATE